MALDAKQKKLLLIGAVAVAAYLAYRWYQSRQQSNNSSGQLGTNLNSVAPALIGGSSGPSSGLNYYAGTTEVYTSNPISQPSGGTTTQGSGGSTSGNNGGSSGLLSWITGGKAFTGTPAQFLQAFQATGQNAGQIVPGGTGKPIPLPPGKSYTS